MTVSLRRVVLLALALLAPGPEVSHAASSTGGGFRLPGYGARAWGASGAVAAFIDDESAVEWNPAQLGLVARVAGLSYVNLVPGTSLGQAQAAYAMPFGRRHDSGISPHAAGAIYTNLSADLAGGDSYSENHLRLAYAYTPQPLVSFGVGVRAFLSQSSVAGFDAFGTSVDLAARLALSRRLTLAFVARDAFSRYSYDDGRDFQIEREFVVGIASAHAPHVKLEIDAARRFSAWSRVMLGAESEYFFSVVALRAGIVVERAGDTRSVPSFGASARAFRDRLSIHYAATIDEDEALGTAHRVSLGVRL